MFESLARAFAEHPPDARASIEDDYVARTGMLPTALRDDLTAGMFSEDPAAQVAAAGRLVAFEDADPALTAEIPDDTLTRARAITDFAFPGLPPARTVQLADERVAREVEAVQAEGEKAQEAEDEPPAEDFPDVSEDEPEFDVLDETEDEPGAKKVQPLADPWPQSTVTWTYRNKIAEAEQSSGYQDENPSSKAWGRYQLTPTARQDIGLERRDGSLIPKYGIKTKEEFLETPVAQEKAFADVMKRNAEQLRAKKNNAVQYLGQQIDGVKAKFKITLSGLLAAAHRQGAGAVRQYLDHQKANKWVSKPKTFPLGSKIFKSIETRLRVFENISHKAP